LSPFKVFKIESEWRLMFDSLINNRRRVSLVIKDHVIRFVDTGKPSLSAIRAFGEQYLPEGVIRDGKIIGADDLQITLEQCIDEWAIKRREVQFLVPNPYAVVRKVTVPADIPVGEIGGYLFLEIGSSIHLPFEDPYFDFHVLSQTEATNEVLLFASPESMITEYTTLLESVKLKPVAADLSPLAIYRLYYHLGQANENDHLLCIQFDVQTVHVSIFVQHKLVFMRHLRMNVDLNGWKEIMNQDESVMLEWQGDKEYILGEIQDMVTEIERVMNFYQFSLNQGKSHVTKILLTGEHPYIQDVHEKLSAITEIEINHLFYQGIETVKGQLIPIRYALALGLSLKEVK
jgi:type IV pilus assembly protein PilM